MKILLAYQSGAANRKDPYINLLPTGLCYLHATLLEAGYDSLLANFSAWPPRAINAELALFKPDMIGISQWTHNRHTSMELAAHCRRLFPHAVIVMGGGHATFCHKEILFSGSPVDVVIRGEAETTLLELTERASDRARWPDIPGIAFLHDTDIIETSQRTPLAELDRLPLPARYLNISIGVDLELQSEFIVTTRGCPSACHFCSSPAFWGRKVRFRSPHSIVEEIAYIRQKFGVIYFSIRDDTFTADRARVMEFCSLLMQQPPILWNCQSRVTAIDEELIIAMKRAGCECIQLGVESGAPRILQQLGKKIVPTQIERACSLIRQIGISLSIYLISDIPGETSEDIQQTLNLVQKLHADDGYVSPLAYYPGTQLFQQAVASGEISADIFSGSRDSARYAKDRPHASARLLRVISQSRQDQPERFARQKEQLGYCFTTNVIASESYRQNGDYKAAEQELLEIAAQQPDNPWGWFLRGELYRELGKRSKAAKCFETVLKLVPQHGPSKAALTQ
ncbi:MAG TPA: radical SAM protein [Desulfuromonadales bacterium]|nr:radical SAM protein [Desulfuromonadales bacterium]